MTNGRPALGNCALGSLIGRLSTIKNEVQLSSMVKDRSGISEEQAKSEVEVWMRGKEF
jgi:hypothetical protein